MCLSCVWAEWLSTARIKDFMKKILALAWLSSSNSLVQTEVTSRRPQGEQIEFIVGINMAKCSQFYPVSTANSNYPGFAGNDIWMLIDHGLISLYLGREWKCWENVRWSFIAIWAATEIAQGPWNPLSALISSSFRTLSIFCFCLLLFTV